MRRAWAILAIVATAVLGTAWPAAAHVEVQPGQAAAGQPATFAFRMPNEESNANTVSLVVHFPADHPVPGVAATAPAGWTAEVTMRTLPAPLTVAGTTVTEVADMVTWRGSMPPGKADYFAVTTGPLPTDTGELIFDAVQTYDNGQVVDWNQQETPGGPEPTHPAPVLAITGASVPPATTAAAHDHAAATDPATTGSGGGSSAGVVIGVVAAAVIAIAAVTVVLYRRIG